MEKFCSCMDRTTSSHTKGLTVSSVGGRVLGTLSNQPGTLGRTCSLGG